jgi:single-stranded DNA-binding protein
MLLQNLNVEMFAGDRIEPKYTDQGKFYVSFSACWSRGTDEKIWFDCVTWGNVVQSDKPTAKELGWLAAYVAENLKAGDRIVVQGRLQGTKDGRPEIWHDKDGNPHASSPGLVVSQLSITQPKAERPVKPTTAHQHPVSDEEIAAAENEELVSMSTSAPVQVSTMGTKQLVPADAQSTKSLFANYKSQNK